MRHACWCVKVSGLLWLNVWLLKEHLDWILDFLHFQYFDQAGSILDWVWHFLCVGYLINPLFISLSRHGDLISPRLVILFSEHGDLKNSIQVMLFSKHGEHIKSRLVMSFSKHGARIKPRLVLSFSRQGDLWKPKLEMSFSKHGDNINSWVVYLFAKFGKLKYPVLDKLICTIGCYVDPILDIVIFVFFQSWIQMCARFGICLNPLWIFLNEPNLGKLHFFEIWILLETRKFPGENQVKSMLDIWSVFHCFQILVNHKGQNSCFW